MSDFEKEPNELFNGEESQKLNEDNKSETAEQAAPDREPEREASPAPEQDAYRGYGYSHPEGDFRDRGGKPKKQKNGTSSLLIAFCLVLFVFIGISVGAIFDVGRDSGDPSQTTSESSSGTSGMTDGSSQSSQKPMETAPGASVIAPDTDEYISVFREVANKCLKTVVEIRTNSGAGSGVIYDPNGYIVTNYHVADEMSTSIAVILYDGSQYQAQYIYGDELSDIAVIKIEKTDCDYAVFGDSDQMTYGDMVLAIGNARGMGLSVTDGIISRPSEAIVVGNATMTLLRTSAAVNSGNSGGGLFNLNGELIGIVNAKLAETSVNDTIDNIGYAIPSQIVVKCINDLKDYGYITGRARLGISASEIPYYSYKYTLPQVVGISSIGSSANSDLRVGDILYQCEGVSILSSNGDSFSLLTQQLTKYSIGERVKLVVLRPTIEYTGNNYSQYMQSLQQVEIEITFIVFDPNVS